MPRVQDGLEGGHGVSDFDGKIESMRPNRGRFVVDAKGAVRQTTDDGLPIPEGVTVLPTIPTVVEPVPVMGPTRVGEWLMVDIRVAKAVQPGSRIFKICQDVSERGHCGVVESTLVIDLLEVRPDEDRRFLLTRLNWPTPKN